MLGYRSVSEAQQAISSAEFSEWIAYESLEPDPATWTMQLVAQLLALTANVHRDPRRQSRPYQPADFLPRPIESEADKAVNRQWVDVLAEMRAAYMQRSKKKN